jgi:hypothetical protein
MASYYSLMINAADGILKPDDVEAVLNDLKDWLRFNASGWLVYTSLTPPELRQKLRDKLSGKDFSILIVASDITNWAAFSKPLSREWIKKQREADIAGE